MSIGRMWRVVPKPLFRFVHPGDHRRHTRRTANGVSHAVQAHMLWFCCQQNGRTESIAMRNQQPNGRKLATLCSPSPAAFFTRNTQISKLHSTICEQLFKPSDHGRGKRRRESQEAEAASTAVSKTFSKLEHPKGSGLLVARDLKKLVSCESTSRPESALPEVVTWRRRITNFLLVLAVERLSSRIVTSICTLVLTSNTPTSCWWKLVQLSFYTARDVMHVCFTESTFTAPSTFPSLLYATTGILHRKLESQSCSLR